jgi:hypothetical protein
MATIFRLNKLLRLSGDIHKDLTLLCNRSVSVHNKIAMLSAGDSIVNIRTASIKNLLILKDKIDAELTERDRIDNLTKAKKALEASDFDLASLMA